MAEFERPFQAGIIYRHALLDRRDDGALFYTVPERLPFEDRDDTIIHVGSGSEFLWDLAQRYYGQQRENAFDLWEVIGLFQLEPIQDASVPVSEGQVVLIPCLRMLKRSPMVLR